VPTDLEQLEQCKSGVILLNLKIWFECSLWLDCTGSNSSETERCRADAPLEASGPSMLAAAHHSPSFRAAVPLGAEQPGLSSARWQSSLAGGFRFHAVNTDSKLRLQWNECFWRITELVRDKWSQKWASPEVSTECGRTTACIFPRASQRLWPACQREMTTVPALQRGWQRTTRLRAENDPVRAALSAHYQRQPRAASQETPKAGPTRRETGSKSSRLAILNGKR